MNTKTLFAALIVVGLAAILLAVLVPLLSAA